MNVNIVLPGKKGGQRRPTHKQKQTHRGISLGAFFFSKTTPKHKLLVPGRDQSARKRTKQIDMDIVAATSSPAFPPKHKYHHAPKPIDITIMDIPDEVVRFWLNILRGMVLTVSWFVACSDLCIPRSEGCWLCDSRTCRVPRPRKPPMAHLDCVGGFFWCRFASHSRRSSTKITGSRVPEGSGRNAPSKSAFGDAWRDC
jgi:hypothetical protein